MLNAVKIVVPCDAPTPKKNPGSAPGRQHWKERLEISNIAKVESTS